MNKIHWFFIALLLICLAGEGFLLLWGDYGKPFSTARFAYILQWQYFFGWLASLLGLGFIASAVFMQPRDQVPYEIVTGKHLLWLVLLAACLALTYVVQALPLPTTDKTAWLRLQPYAIALSSLLAAGISLAAILAAARFPRTLLVLLMVIQLHFAVGVGVAEFWQQTVPPSDWAGLLQPLRAPLLQAVVLGAVVAIFVGLSTLGARRSMLENILEDIKKLQRLQKNTDFVKSLITGSELAQDVKDTLKALEKVLNPPPKLSPDEQMKKLLADLEYRLKEMDVRKEYTLREETLDTLLKLFANPPHTDNPDNKGDKKEDKKEDRREDKKERDRNHPPHPPAGGDKKDEKPA